MIVQGTMACDQCSVQVGSGVILDGHYVGHRFRFRKQYGDFGMGKSLDGPKHLDHFADRGEIKELFTVHEVMGNYHIRGNWHLTAAIPLVNNYLSIDGETKFDIYGLGDPWVLIRNQRFWDRENGKLWFFFGLGAKFPMGRTNVTEEGRQFDLDMQPGSGSIDLLSSVSVVREYQPLFLLGQAAFSYMGESPGNYRYANALTANAAIGFHLSPESYVETSALIGASTEILGSDETDDVRTGGPSITVYADAGLQLQLNKRLIGSVRGHRAVITEVDDRQLPTHYKLRTSLRYSF